MTPKIRRRIGQEKSGAGSNAIRETRYLLSVPGMGESIRKSMKTPASKLANQLRW